MCESRHMRPKGILCLGFAVGLLLSVMGCSGTPKSDCNDGIDNDSDGTIDEAGELAPAAPLEGKGAASTPIFTIAAGGDADQCGNGQHGMHGARRRHHANQRGEHHEEHHPRLHERDIVGDVAAGIGFKRRGRYGICDVGHLKIL
jgi:hypothetical protein